MDVARVIAHSIWDILGYGHTGRRTSYNHLRWVKFGWSWTIWGWIVRNRAVLYDVAAIEGHRTTSWRFLVMFTPWFRFRDVEYHTIIAWRHATSRMYVPYFHMFLFVWPSHDVVPWSCDVLRHRTISHNHRTIVFVLNDDISFSADNHIAVQRPRTTVIMTVVRCRTISMRLSTCLRLSQMRRNPYSLVWPQT